MNAKHFVSSYPWGGRDVEISFTRGLSCQVDFWNLGDEGHDGWASE
jgi:hypothetical protein